MIYRSIPNVGVTIALLSALMICGCSGYRSPSIQLTSVRMNEESEEASVFTFELELQNPNPEPIRLREFHYRLRMNGQEVYVGRRAASTTLHSHALQTIELPAVVRFQLLGWTRRERPQSLSYELTGTLLYETPGELAEILLDIGVRRPKVTFAKVGRLDITEGR